MMRGNKKFESYCRKV